MRDSLYKKIKIQYIKTAILAAGVAALFAPSIQFFHSTGENFFQVSLNGQMVGTASDRASAIECMTQARKSIASESEDLVLIDTDLTLAGEEVLFGTITGEKMLTSAMEAVMRQEEVQTLNQAFTVKINSFTVNLANISEVQELLQAAINKYDSTESYGVELVQDTSRTLNVLTTTVYSEQQAAAEAAAAELAESGTASLPEAGIFAAFTEMAGNIQETDTGKDLSEYNLGLINMNFGDTVEVVETYMPESRLSGLDVAIEEVTKDQETNKIYEVVSGDTLGEIAATHNMSTDDLVAMNTMLADANSMIRVGDELIINVPEPELSVERQEQLYYEEDYDAPIQYVENDDWYTNETKTLQQPSSGHRRVVAIVSYRNASVSNTEIVKEDVVMEAVPKIVEKGTKIPPTYIKPISGGRLTSGFGRRKAPKKGASTYHQGVDWATPTGTAVMASCGGVVSKTGWLGGSGYSVYIEHPDGKQTRYLHLSKILVKVGQSVSQGQKIALSGNTGVSTGPHLHFAVRINGVAVNPLKYLN